MTWWWTARPIPLCTPKNRMEIGTKLEAKGGGRKLASKGSGGKNIGGPCGLVFQACLPSWFLFWAALSPKLVSLHDVASGLLLAAAAALSLHLHSGLLLAAAAALCPKLVSLYIYNLFWATLGCRLVSHVTRYVSLRDFPSGLLLATAAVSQAACLPSSCLHDFPPGLLLAAAAALSPHLPSGLLLVAAPAYMITPGGCSWLPLPPWLPSLSPFLNSLLGCSSSCSCCILFLFLWCCWFADICCLLLVPVLVFLVLWLWM